MPDDVFIRPAEPRDLSAIHNITARAFAEVSIDAKIERHYGRLQGTDWISRKCAVVSAELEGNPDGCFVALSDGGVVGYVTTTVDGQTGVGRVLNLAVNPDLHGRGLGKRLLRRAFQHFRQHGAPYYRIETTVDNEVGQALYPRCGFREITRQIIYFMSAEEAADWTRPDQADWGRHPDGRAEDEDVSRTQRRTVPPERQEEQA